MGNLKFIGLMAAVGVAEIIWAGWFTLAIFKEGIKRGMKMQRQFDRQRKQNQEFKKTHG